MKYLQILSVILFFSTIAFAQYSEGDVLFSEGRYAEAYDYYAGQVFTDPLNEALNLKFAETAILLEKYQSAIMTYERILMSGENPDVQRRLVRLLLQTGNLPQAQAEYVKLIQNFPDYADVELSNALYKNNRLKVYGRIGLTGIYDSNANSGTTTGQVWSWFLNQPLNIPSLKKVDSAGAATNAFLGAEYALNKEMALTGSTSVYYQNNFEEDLMNNQDSLWWNVSTALRYLAAEKHLFEIRLAHDFTRQKNEDDTPQTFSPGFTLSHSIVFKEKFMNTASFSGNYKRYTENRLNDGYMAMLGDTLRFFINSQASLSLGVKGFSYDANENQYSYMGYELALNGQYMPWERLYLAPYFIFRQETYEAPADFLIDSFDRDDKIIRTGLSVSILLPKHFNIDLNGGYIWNDSNSALYNYEKYSVSAGLSKTF